MGFFDNDKKITVDDIICELETILNKRNIFYKTAITPASNNKKILMCHLKKGGEYPVIPYRNIDTTVEPILGYSFFYDKGGLKFKIWIDDTPTCEHRELIQNIISEIPFRINPLKNIGSLYTCLVDLCFLDPWDVVFLLETKDEDERKIILEHKFEAFNFNYLNTITNKIYDTIKDFENGITHVNTKVEEMPQKSDKSILTSNESVSAYFDKVANYVHDCFNIQSLMTPDKMTIFFLLNIGVNDLHQTAISLTFFDEADYQKKIMFNIVKMNGTDSKNSIILKKDFNLISLEELENNFDNCVLKTTDYISEQLNKLNEWKKFLDEVKSYIKENSICSVAMNNDFAIMFPLIKDIDLSTIAGRIYIDSKEDCADCIECSIVKFHEGMNKKIHVIKKEMLTVFETEINTEIDYQNSIAKTINWLKEQITKYENQKF